MTLDTMRPDMFAVSNASAYRCLSVSAHYVVVKIIPWSNVEVGPTVLAMFAFLLDEKNMVPSANRGYLGFF